MVEDNADLGPGPRGHLGAAWEVAVVSAFVLVIVAVVGVVIFQVRRRRIRRAEKEGRLRGDSKDLERGNAVEMDPEEAGLETEVEDEIEEVLPKSKRVQKSRSRSRPKFKHASSKPKCKSKRRKDKALSLSSSPTKAIHKTMDSPGGKTEAEEYYFEHPSQKPPKYYWNYR